ncbi:MAG: hypothetical protein J6N67_05380 [Desulfovibrio sp.]|nr:hypothetical protein [Desulfovibrio sp.]MBO6171573.1 hypothetical protein [Desulfovibrio sp.]
MSERLSAFDLLEGDHNGAGLRRLQEALLALKTSVRQAMDAGLSAEDFSVAQRVLLAVETAEEAAPRLHDKMAG